MHSPTDPSDAAGALRAAEATAHRLAGELFSWDLNRALELALLKTFCVPSISGLLARTGEFEQRPRKRYDDTGLMLAEHRPLSLILGSRLIFEGFSGVP